MDPRFERLLSLLSAAGERAQQLASLNKQLTAEIGRATNVDTAKSVVKTFQNGSTPLVEQELKESPERIDLAKQLAEAMAAPTPGAAVRAEDLAKHFRTLVQTMQLDARRPAEGEVATTLKSFEVELKGLIVVQDDEARVLTPAPGTAVDPGQLSTIRMSFGSIPGLSVRDTAAEPVNK